MLVARQRVGNSEQYYLYCGSCIGARSVHARHTLGTRSLHVRYGAAAVERRSALQQGAGNEIEWPCTQCERKVYECRRNT